MAQPERTLSARITFEQVNQWLDCPYCHAALGVPCTNRLKGQPTNDPHPSRAKAALRLVSSDGFLCENCEYSFLDGGHLTDDGYWLCATCWKDLTRPASGAKCAT
jgi:hypothetical protein